MQKLISIVFTVLLLTSITSRAQILIDSKSLNEKLGKKDLVILHVGKEELYKSEHIPGARYVNENSFVIDVEPHAFDLPPTSDLQTVFENLGISNSSQIVIYTEANWIPTTTRLFLTFDYLGLRNQTSILNGGLIAWKAFGGKTTSEIPAITKGTLKINPRKDLVVDKEYIKQNLNKTGVNIVDCRAAVYYQGIEFIEMHGGRKGRIPGAKSIPFTTTYSKTENGSYEFKSAQELKKLFEQQGFKKDDQIILYCHIGLQMTAVYVASQVAGYTNVKVFDGSFHEWGADKDLPVEL